MSGVTEIYGTEPRLVGQRYELGAAIGYGGMAEVFRGRDLRLGREVAVKMLRGDLARDPTFLARFEREAKSSAALNHPAIVSVYDTGKDVVNGVEIPYIVMEFIEGRTLRDVLQAQGRFPERRAMEITSDVCAALDYSHRMGIIHRDIKPANVMLCPDGSVKVMDFGIARATTATSSTMTATAAVIGTAQYLSPEQARGARVDARSDVYSTGVLFYELLSGEPPFRGDNPVAVAYQHVREHPQPPSYHDPDISAMADAIVRHAMQKSPDERYQSAGKMRDDLERALAGRTITAPMGTAASAGDDQLATRMGSPPTSAGTRVMPRGGSSYQDPYADRTERYDESSYDDPYGGYDQYSDRTERYGGGGYGGPGDRYDATDESGRYDDDDDGRDGRRGRGNAWKFVLAGLGVILVFVVVTLLATSLFGGTGGDKAKDKATIPTGLVGKPVGVAQAQLERLGFTDVRRKNEQRQDKPKDTVLDVNPAMGTEVAKTTPITLTVATEPGQVTVPEVVGQTEAVATQRLTGAGFTVETTQFTGPTTRNSGTVESTDPVGNTSAEKGSLVTLSIVSEQAQIPTVTGQPIAAARSALQSYGFQVVEQRTANAAPADTVVGLSPGEGSTVARHSQVVVYVSMGQPTQPPTTAPPTSPGPTETGPPQTTEPPIFPPDTNPGGQQPPPGGNGQ